MIRNSSLFKRLSGEARQELISLSTLADIPKVAYSTKLALTVYPENTRMKKTFWSHIEVYQMVESAALTIRELGVKPRSVVAMVSPNSFESCIFFLAVQWSGAVIVMIDPSLSVTDIKETIQETGATIVVSPLSEDEDEANFEVYQKCVQSSSELGLIHWCMYTSKNEGFKLDSKGKRAADRPAWSGGNKDLTLDPDETSIRVLVPVQGRRLLLSLSQKNICTAVKAFVGHYALNESSATLWTTPLHSIQGILVFLSSLYVGGNTVIPRVGVLDVSQFWTICEADKVSWMSMPANQVSEVYQYTKSNSPTVSSLDFVRSCPGFLPKESISGMESVFKTSVLESYGPPEASGFATGNLETERKAGTFGKPVAVSAVLPSNAAGVAGEIASVIVVDSVSGARCAANHEGDIAVAGLHVVMQGYDNDAEETELSVVTIDQQQFLKTGERGFFDDEGFLVVKDVDRLLKGEVLRTHRAEAAALAAVEAERLKQEEELRKKEEEAKMAEEERKRKEQEAAAAAAAASAAAAAALAAEEAEKQRAEEERLAALEQQRREELEAQKRAEEDRLLGEKKAAEMRAAREYAEAAKLSGIDASFFAKVNERLQSIEERTSQIEQGIAMKHRKELEEMKKRLAEMELEKKIADEEAVSARTVTGVAASSPILMEVNMKEIENNVMSAADAAEASNVSMTRATGAMADSKETGNPDETTQYALEAAAAAMQAAASAQAVAEFTRSVVKAAPPKPEIIEEEKLVGKTPDEYKVEKRVRVNFEEIENAMRNHPGVKNAMAYGSKTDPNEEYQAAVICVAVQPKRGARCSQGWLRLHAQSVLPAHLVPSRYYVVDRFPEYRHELAECENPEVTFLNARKRHTKVNAPQWSPPVPVSPKSDAGGNSKATK